MPEQTPYICFGDFFANDQFDAEAERNRWDYEQWLDDNLVVDYEFRNNMVEA